jgi:hypothetical protein
VGYALELATEDADDEVGAADEDALLDDTDEDEEALLVLETIALEDEG